MKKPTHGGARTGAGAKPKYNEPTTTIAFRVPISKKQEVYSLVMAILLKYQKTS